MGSGLTETRAATSAIATGAAVTLAVNGMTCGACAARIERRLNRVEGVSARVNYANERAFVTLSPGVGVGRVLEEVNATGFSAVVVTEELPRATTDDERVRDLGRRLLVAGLLLMPICDVSLAFWAIPAARFPGWQWLTLALAAPVVCWSAWPFYRGAVRAARHGGTSMDTLVSIGIVSSTAWSVYAMFWRDTGHVSRSLLWILAHGSVGGIYFEVAAGVTTFLLAGRYFEARARRRAGDALSSLAALRARDVAVLGRDGTERRLPVSALAVGDRFVTRPGEAIATDGEVEIGESALDCSAMTGESVPIDVRPGDPVTGGTVLLNGRLVIRATRVGADTQLAQMVALVEHAQNEKAAAQRLADRISAVFVPVVLVIAGATLAVWLVAGHDAGQAANASLSVLIIACPCALGLATPAALIVASNEGARQGIFFKSYGALERSRHIDTVVLDKTGTLTEGKMAVVGLWTGPDVSEATLLRWVGAVEACSEHPIAKAITTCAAARLGALPMAENFVEFPGRGVRGFVDGHWITIGKGARTTLGDSPSTPGPGFPCNGTEAHTTAVVDCDDVLAGVVAVSDRLRPTAREAVAELQALGLRCVLVSGDSQVLADTIGTSLGIPEIVGAALPAEKVAVVERLRAEGRTVAVVGDGVNDGPALAAADLGIGLGSGADVAINAADLIVLRDDLRVVAVAVSLARRTLRTIRGNLAWAFAYNAVAIPLAAAGVLDPLIAGAAMALSSGLVVYNSSRIARRRAMGVSPLLNSESGLSPEPTLASTAG
jgi:P-type Cu+ transporter